jgi:hypothetical protein
MIWVSTQKKDPNLDYIGYFRDHRAKKCRGMFRGLARDIDY